MNPWEQPPPGPADERRIEVLRVPAGASWRVVVTGNRIAALHVHYSDGRTIPCMEPWEGGCHNCRRGLSYRREGYFSAWIMSRRVSAVLVLPDVALQDLERIHKDRVERGALRHTGLLLERHGESRRAPLKVSWFGDSVGGEPAGVDVPYVLCRAWGMPTLLDHWRNRLAKSASAAG